MCGRAGRDDSEKRHGGGWGLMVVGCHVPRLTHAAIALMAATNHVSPVLGSLV